MKSIEMYNAPISVLENYTEMGLSGMSINDLSFLCGLIKKFKPKKIVEIGVAAGGSTTVILECLKLLNYKSEMYSVDICKRCYFKPEENSGFIAADYLKKHELDNIKHKFILGKTIASAVEEIGEKVDFVIIDAMHSLPGELLDFICVYPLMTGKNGGTVVFHDVGQCQIGFQNIHGAPFEYASLITMLAGGGIKYWGGG